MKIFLVALILENLLIWIFKNNLFRSNQLIKSIVHFQIAQIINNHDIYTK